MRAQEAVLGRLPSRRAHLQGEPERASPTLGGLLMIDTGTSGTQRQAEQTV